MTDYRTDQRSYAGIIALVIRPDCPHIRPPPSIDPNEFHKRRHLVIHKFNIGQLVDLTPKKLRAAALGSYEIRSLVPAPDNDLDDPCYRIKSVAEKHERMASESELTLSASVFA